MSIATAAVLRRDPSRLDPAFARVRVAVQSGEVPDAVLAVADGEGEIRAEAHTRRPGRLTTESRFMVASITKPIVATAIMQLVETGRLDLHAPVGQLIPGFAPPPAAPGLPGGEAISAWHILTHTSGIPDVDTDRLYRERPSRGDMLRIAATDRLRFAPGSQFEYVSSSFYVLGELIRRLGGLPHAEYLRVRVLAPLGMVGTGFAMPTDRGSRVPVHGFGPQGPLQALLLRAFASLEHPGGGLWSTAPDLLRFGRAMLLGGELDGARVLGPTTLAEMTREQTRGLQEAGATPAEPAHDARYALGWTKLGLDPQLPGGSAQFGHGGATGSLLWIDPERDLVIVLLANVWEMERTLQLAVVRAVYGALAG